MVVFNLQNIFLRFGREESYQYSSENKVDENTDFSEVAEVAEVTGNAEVTENAEDAENAEVADYEMMVELDIAISLLSDFPEDSVSLEAEGFNNIIK